MVTDNPLQVKSKRQKAFYNEMYKGQEYSQSEREEQMKDYNEIVRILSKYFPGRDPITLEIGCGRGMFQNITERYIGLDLAFSAASHIKDKAKLVASGENLSFKSNSFDFIFSLTTIEHFIHPENGLREIERILKPGGFAYLHVAWYCNPWTVQGLAYKQYKELDFMKKLSKFVMPIRKHFYYRFFTNVPRRALCHFWYSLVKHPVSLRYKKLFPDYSVFYAPDSDAACALDPHDMMLYFLSRGYELLSGKGLKTMILADYPALLIRKPN